MRTTLIPGTEPRKDDEKIVKKLKKGGITLGGKTMRIGIKNEAGVIYRSIETVGMDQFLDSVESLEVLQFIDELENSTGTKNGYDAIFIK